MKKYIEKLKIKAYHWLQKDLGFNEQKLWSTSTPSLHVTQFAKRMPITNRGVLESESLGFGGLVELNDFSNNPGKDWKQNIKSVQTVKQMIDKMYEDFLVALSKDQKAMESVIQFEVEQSLRGVPANVIMRIVAIQPKK